MLKYLFFILSIFIFAGCSLKTQYSSSKAYSIVIKNLQVAVADTGFIKKNSSNINLQIFSASTPILDINIKSDRVCLGLSCLNKEAFNSKFFGFYHYKHFIDDIFSYKPIYNGKNIIKNINGFEQSIQTADYDIIYKVNSSALYFKDSKNKILIKLKELK